MLGAWVGALGLAMVLWLAPAAAGAPPPNDDFADREVLGGSLPIEVSRSNVEATKESGEWLGHAFEAGHSVWFGWQATDSGWVTIGACSEDFDTIVGIYTGSAVDSLTPVVNGNANEGPYFCGGSGGVYTFWATTGTDYAIAVDGNAFYLPDWSEKPPTEGTFDLRIEMTPPPPNDDFAAATVLPGEISEEPDGTRFYFASDSGYNWGADKEDGEPEHGGDPGGASVWYSWTAPESGSARIHTCCSGPEIVGVYAGDSLGALTPVPPGDGLFPGDPAFTVGAGTTYRIAVDGEFDTGAGEAEMGSFSLRVFMDLPPRPSDRGGVIAAPPEDGIPPATTIVRRRLKPAQRRATFAFRSSEPGSSFRCKLDRRAFASCKSPKTFKGLKVGKHTFKVVAVDVADNVDPTPAIVRFSIPGPAKR